MTGKQKCAILKEIRRDIAKKNDINIRIDECTHKGECRGTCPRCEAEVRILEREIERKRKRGFQTALAGVSAGILAASLASCVPTAGDDVKPDTETQIESLAGAPVMPDPETEDDETRVEKTEGEIAVTEGLIAEPDCDVPDIDTPVTNRDDFEDEYPLMGEPPVLDFEIDEYDMPTAGLPVPADLVAAAGGEWPEHAGIPVTPDDPNVPEQSND